MKTISRKYLKTTAASVGIAALLALTACSGSDDKEPAPEPASSSAAEEETTEAPAPDDTDEATTTDEAEGEDGETSDSADGGSADGELTEIKASSEKGTDSVLEHSFEATGIALGFKGSGDRVDPPGNNKYVAIKVKATAGTKYANGLNCTSFKLKDERASQARGSTSQLEERLEELGLTPFERIRSGESGEGWCGYYLEDPTKDNLTMEYSRLGLKDSDGNEEPPESKELKITPEG